MIPVNVEQIFLSNMGFVVILKPDEDTRVVPIFIGAAEAQAIAIQMQNITPPRPLTHDLLKSVCDNLGGTVLRVEVCDIKDGTFYGRLIIEADGLQREIDCRPSDAIAIALRAGCPILIDEKVMNEAGRVLDSLKMEAGAGTGGKPHPAPQKSPSELLESKLEAAIREERYEDAARLRDRLAEMKKHGHN